MDLIKELSWRGLVYDIMPQTQELLNKEQVTGYSGFDPTADSLHIGNMIPVILLMHLQRAGHKPLALVGGATGMIGDPSGKSKERNLLSLEDINHNLECQKKQLSKFLDFDDKNIGAEIVNNYDWYKDLNVLSFIRDIGKHVSINYMMAKDSVKSRLETGMSFTEFTYQLIQAYDFYYLYKNKGCKLQMGGSDQWGNITTGTELIRRIDGGEAFALTAPLVKKADGSKFGKSEGGNIWIDAEKTSPFKFYQFWLKVSDEDAKNFIKIFTFLNEDEVNHLIEEHDIAAHTRILQKEIAKRMTELVHSNEAYDLALKATNILFGKTTFEALNELTANQFSEVFEGVPKVEISSTNLNEGVGIIEALVDNSNFLPSRGEANRQLKQNSISVNKQKITRDYILTNEDLIANKYILLQKGKKEYFLVEKV